MTHKFSVGQSVGYRSRRTLETLFNVVQLLPNEDSFGVPRYKVKAAAGESFERVVQEADLTLG